MAEVRIVATRRTLPVEPSKFRGGQAFVAVDVCVDCGSVVVDAAKHVKWHSLIATVERSSDGSGS